jgi:hypothetical protein
MGRVSKAGRRVRPLKTMVDRNTGRIWIECEKGWISYGAVDPVRFLVTATNQKQRHVSSTELNIYLHDLIQELGGPVETAG